MSSDKYGGAFFYIATFNPRQPLFFGFVIQNLIYFGGHNVGQ